ncbi:MAG: hypothetical protein JNN30_05680 [Rhodanobacteraceae bacterium]|nr:hypothetical protein [Rhodanobacteraceae bacterium]
MFVACDMGELFRSENRGRSWQAVDARQTQAFAQTTVRFTSDPQVLFGLLWNYSNDHGAPGRSSDGGRTWQRASTTAWPADRLAQKLFADRRSTQRLLVATEEVVYLSTDAGASFRAVHDPSGVALFVAGAFFDGDRAYLGTESGLMRLDLSDPAASFVPVSATGWPAGTSMAEMTAAREGGILRIVAIANSGALYLDNGDPYYYEEAVWDNYAGIYRLDLADGQPGAAWLRRDDGFRVGLLNAGGCPNPGGRDDRPTHISMADNDIDVIYAGGYPSPCNGEDIRVYRTLDGGQNWSSILAIGSSQNAQTGWMGFGSGDRTQTYDAPLRGISVDPRNPAVVAYSGNGFVHVTENGTDPDGISPSSGVIWRQAYTDPVQPNLPGAPTPTRRYYRSVGLENTSVWDLAWSTPGSSQQLFAAFTDIRGIRSTDGGGSWAFDYDFGANSRNSTYRVTRHASHAPGVLYAVVSGVHDLYQSHRARDSYANDTNASRSGLLLRSADHGATWQRLRDFGRQAVWLEIDPANAERAFVSVLFFNPASSTEEGGIYMTENLSAGSAASWQRLPSPPRTEGRPLVVRVLPNNGGLVASYSVRRRDSGEYTASSGVFYKPTLDATANWQDRSDPGMRYWTKDVVVDPHDPSASTWYAAVFSSAPAPGTGGVYRTTDRGLHWTRILAGVSAESITVDPLVPSLAWVTTWGDGLWRSGNLTAASPNFQRDPAYPFGHPLRVIANPNNAAERWVLSFGNGLRVGYVTGDLLFRDGFEGATP